MHVPPNGPERSDLLLGGPPHRPLAAQCRGGLTRGLAALADHTAATYLRAHAHPIAVEAAPRLGLCDLLEPGVGARDFPGRRAGDPEGPRCRLGRPDLPLRRGGAAPLGGPPHAALLALRRVVARAGHR